MADTEQPLLSRVYDSYGRDHPTDTVDGYLKRLKRRRRHLMRWYWLWHKLRYQSKLLKGSALTAAVVLVLICVFLSEFLALLLPCLYVLWDAWQSIRLAENNWQRNINIALLLILIAVAIALPYVLPSIPVLYIGISVLKPFLVLAVWCAFELLTYIPNQISRWVLVLQKGTTAPKLVFQSTKNTPQDFPRENLLAFRAFVVKKLEKHGSAWVLFYEDLSDEQKKHYTLSEKNQKHLIKYRQYKILLGAVTEKLGRKPTVVIVNRLGAGKQSWPVLTPLNTKQDDNSEDKADAKSMGEDINVEKHTTAIIKRFMQEKYTRMLAKIPVPQGDEAVSEVKSSDNNSIPSMQTVVGQRLATNKVACERQSCFARLFSSRQPGRQQARLTKYSGLLPKCVHT